MRNFNRLFSQYSPIYKFFCFVCKLYCDMYMITTLRVFIKYIKIYTNYEADFGVRVIVDWRNQRVYSFFFANENDVATACLRKCLVSAIGRTHQRKVESNPIWREIWEKHNNIFWHETSIKSEHMVPGQKTENEYIQKWIFLKFLRKFSKQMSYNFREKYQKISKIISENVGE